MKRKEKWIVGCMVTLLIILALSVPLWLAAADGDVEESEAMQDGAPTEVPDEVEAAENPWEKGDGETFYAYFERVWLDKIAGYVCVLLGAISAVAVSVGKVRKAHALLASNEEKLGESQKRLDKTQAELAETRDVFLKETAAVKEALQNVLAAQEALQATYLSAYGTLDNIKKAVLVGFCNDGELVRTGYAKEVARLLGVNDEEGR